MKTLSIVFSALLVASCATGFNPRFYYTTIEVANLSGSDISNVEVQVGTDGRNLRCDTVVNNAICQERSGKRPYPTEQGVRLSWVDGDGNSQSQQLQPSLPATMSSGIPVQVMMDINADGSVRAWFRQDTLRPSSR